MAAGAAALEDEVVVASRRHGGWQRRRRWRRAGSIRGRPDEVIAERAGLIVLADLVGTIEDRAGALNDPGLRGFETRRCHASGIRRIRATSLADPILRDAIEAEGRVNGRAGNQISLVHVCADGRRVERRAQTAVGAAFRDGPQIYRVVEDGVDIDEVHAVRNVEALAVGVFAVGGYSARQVFRSGTRSRVVAEREWSASTGDEIARSERDVGVGGPEAGRPVGRIAPERMRVGNEVNDARRRRRRRLRSSSAVASGRQKHGQYEEISPRCTPHGCELTVNLERNLPYC